MVRFRFAVTNLLTNQLACLFLPLTHSENRPMPGKPSGVYETSTLPYDYELSHVQ